MPNEITAAAGRRFAFDAWKGASRLPQRLFVLNYIVREDEVPGWNMRKVKQMRAAPGMTTSDPSGRAIEVAEATPGRALPRAAYPTMLTLPSTPAANATAIPIGLPPPHTRSFWQPGGSSDKLVEAELYECSSVMAAHEWLLYLLGVFESPLIDRVEPPEIGDVCFSGPAPTAFLFARGNMVVNVRNASRDSADVTHVAASIDADLTGKPAVQHTRRKRTREAHIGGTVALEIPAARAQGLSSTAAAPISKVFYTGGEIEAQADGLYFRADEPGSRSLEVYTIDPTGRTEYRELRVQITTE